MNTDIFLAYPSKTFIYKKKWKMDKNLQSISLNRIIILESILSSSDKPNVLFQKEAEMKKINTNGQSPSNNSSCN